MICRKCKKEIPDESKFCLFCGTEQEKKRHAKSRGNGQGSVYQLKNKSWIAIMTVKYEMEDGKLCRRTRSKSGFKTKREALEYLPQLKGEKKAKKVFTFKELYDLWLPTHRAGRSTIVCYKSAFKYFKPIWDQNLIDIEIEDLQECMDDCPKGKRTRQNMKATAGLIYKYALPRRIIDINLAEYLVVSGDDGAGKAGLPIEYLQVLEKNIGKMFGADYIVCQCYLGYRPTEFVQLSVEDYNKKERAFFGGIKTEAGMSRVVTVSPKIQPIIDRLISGKASGQIFCSEDGTPMSTSVYRALFYSVLDKCGLDNPVTVLDGKEMKTYTPHSCRHTFATLMKRVKGAEKDKLELIGHTDASMLRHYQDVSYDDLRKITDAISS